MITQFGFGSWPIAVLLLPVVALLPIATLLSPVVINHQANPKRLYTQIPSQKLGFRC